MVVSAVAIRLILYYLFADSNRIFQSRCALIVCALEICATLLQIQLVLAHLQVLAPVLLSLDCTHMLVLAFLVQFRRIFQPTITSC